MFLSLSEPEPKKRAATFFVDKHSRQNILFHPIGNFQVRQLPICSPNGFPFASLPLVRRAGCYSICFSNYCALGDALGMKNTTTSKRSLQATLSREMRTCAELRNPTEYVSEGITGTTAVVVQVSLGGVSVSFPCISHTPETLLPVKPSARDKFLLVLAKTSNATLSTKYCLFPDVFKQLNVS